MYATALERMGYDPENDFVVKDPVGNGAREDMVLTWLSKDKPRPKMRDIEAMADALEQGVVEPLKPPPTAEERLVSLESIVAAQAATIEELRNQTGTLEAKWSAE